MDEDRWSQSSVSEAPEAATSGVRRAEDGPDSPIPEAPPATAYGLGEKARTIARRTGDSAAVAANALKEQGHQASHYLLRSVEQNPLASILIAGIVGYALAHLNRRS